MNENLIIPKLPNPEGQAKLILASNAMQLVTPVFFQPNANDIAIEQSQQPDSYNWMGNPVFDTIQFDPVSYEQEDYFSNSNFLSDTGQTTRKVSLTGLRLEHCMHIVNMTKNIITTPIAGANGTVKEYIGLGDYQITLSGMLVNRYANTPPENEMKLLVDYCKAPIPIPVYSNFLAYFEISTIVISGEPNFTQIEGTRNAIAFTLDCLSDRPFEVEYNYDKRIDIPVSNPRF